MVNEKTRKPQERKNEKEKNHTILSNFLWKRGVVLIFSLFTCLCCFPFRLQMYRTIKNTDKPASASGNSYSPSISETSVPKWEFLLLSHFISIMRHITVYNHETYYCIHSLSLSQKKPRPTVQVRRTSHPLTPPIISIIDSRRKEDQMAPYNMAMITFLLPPYGVILPGTSLSLSHTQTHTWMTHDSKVPVIRK